MGQLFKEQKAIIEPGIKEEVTIPESEIGPKVSQLRQWQKWFGLPLVSYGLGLMVAGAVLLWLALPSRLPALGLLGLVLAGSVARFYALRPVIARKWLRVALTFDNVALVLIMLLAFALRFAGLSQSLPYLDNPDEPTLVNAAIKMLQTGDLNPHFFRWPSLPFYLQFLVSLPTFFAGISNGTIKDLKQIPLENFILAGRAVSALFGTATVFITFLAGRVFYNKQVGWLAALILAILPMHTEHSHYSTPDAVVTFFSTLTLLFAALIFRTGEKRWYLWAGVAAGLTAGSKYNVAVVLATVVLAHLLADKTRRGKLVWLMLTFGLMAGVFLLTTPFALLDLPGFLNEIAFQVRHYTILGHGSASDAPSWQAYLYFFYTEAFLYQASAFVIAAILFALLRQRREDWLVLSFPAIGFLFFSSAKVYFSRNLLPLLPPLAILCAVLLLTLAGLSNKYQVTSIKDKSEGESIKSKRSNKYQVSSVKESAIRNSQLATPNSVPPTTDNRQLTTLLALALLVIFFVFSGWQAFKIDSYYVQPDTRKLAAEWIVQNVPAGAQLRLEPQTPILPENRYPGAEDRRPIGSRPLDWYRQQGYQYLIASSYYYKDLMEQDAEAAANYNALFQSDKLIKEFPGDSRDRPGPTIKIFKL